MLCPVDGDEPICSCPKSQSSIEVSPVRYTGLTGFATYFRTAIKPLQPTSFQTSTSSSFSPTSSTLSSTQDWRRERRSSHRRQRTVTGKFSIHQSSRASHAQPGHLEGAPTSIHPPAHLCLVLAAASSTQSSACRHL